LIGLETRVECHSGSEYGEYPREFIWQGQHLEVVEVLQRWRTPDGKRFRLLAADRQVYELTYVELSQVWLVSSV